MSFTSTATQKVVDINFITDKNRKHYRTEIPNIIDEIGLRPIPFRLYIHFKRYAGGNDTGHCWQNTANLAKICNCSMGAISEAKKELAKRNLIVINKRETPKGLVHDIYVKDIWAANRLYFKFIKESKYKNNQQAIDYILSIGEEEVNQLGEKYMKGEELKLPINMSKPTFNQQEKLEREEKARKTRKARESKRTKQSKKNNVVDIAPFFNDDEFHTVKSDSSQCETNNITNKDHGPIIDHGSSIYLKEEEQKVLFVPPNGTKVKSKNSSSNSEEKPIQIQEIEARKKNVKMPRSYSDKIYDNVIDKYIGNVSGTILGLQFKYMKELYVAGISCEDVILCYEDLYREWKSGGQHLNYLPDLKTVAKRIRVWQLRKDNPYYCNEIEVYDV